MQRQIHKKLGVQAGRHHYIETDVVRASDIDGGPNVLVSSSSIDDAPPVVTEPARMWRYTRSTPNSFNVAPALSNTPSSLLGPPVGNDAAIMIPVHPVVPTPIPVATAVVSHHAPVMAAAIHVPVSLSQSVPRRVASKKSSAAVPSSETEDKTPLSSSASARILQNTLSSSQRVRPSKTASATAGATASSNSSSASLSSSARTSAKKKSKAGVAGVNAMLLKRLQSARAPIRTWQKRRDEPANAEVDINREAPIHIHSIHSEDDNELWNNELQQLRLQYRKARRDRVVNELAGDVKIEAGLSSGMRYAARVHAQAKQRQMERTEKLHRGEGIIDGANDDGDGLAAVLVGDQPMDAVLWSSPLWPRVANRSDLQWRLEQERALGALPEPNFTLPLPDGYTRDVRPVWRGGGSAPSATDYYLSSSYASTRARSRSPQRDTSPTPAAPVAGGSHTNARATARAVAPSSVATTATPPSATPATAAIASAPPQVNAAAVVAPVVNAPASTARPSSAVAAGPSIRLASSSRREPAIATAVSSAPLSARVQPGRMLHTRAPSYTGTTTQRPTTATASSSVVTGNDRRRALVDDIARQYGWDPASSAANSARLQQSLNDASHARAHDAAVHMLHEPMPFVAVA